MPKNVPKSQKSEYQVYIYIEFYRYVKKIDTGLCENLTLHDLMNKRGGKSVIALT